VCDAMIIEVFHSNYSLMYYINLHLNKLYILTLVVGGFKYTLYSLDTALAIIGSLAIRSEKIHVIGDIHQYLIYPGI